MDMLLIVKVMVMEMMKKTIMDIENVMMDYVKMPKKKKKKRKSFWKELRSILKQELLICLMKLRTNSQVIPQVSNLTLSLELVPFREKIYKVEMAVNQQELVENYLITTF